MRSLSSSLSTAFAGPVQRPGWLVSIQFSTSTTRLSSMQDTTYGGQTYYAADVDVSKVSLDQQGGIRGNLVLGNLDDGFGALVLGEGVADRQITITAFDAGAVGTDADFVPIAVAIGGRARIDPAKVSIDLRSPVAYVSTPRAFINAAHGFTYLLPAGVEFKIGGQTYKLER